MELLKNPLMPWSVKHRIVQFGLGTRCQLCDEGVGLLCRIDDVYELRCLSCVKGMPNDHSPRGFEDGIVRAKWFFVACSMGSSLKDLSSLSEEDWRE